MPVSFKALPRKLVARDPDEAHRTATPLELLFDLVIVIAISAIASGFETALREKPIELALLHYLMAFFIVWWPWILFARFASSFDNDDAVHRIGVVALMFGAMFVAVDLPEFFRTGELAVGFIGVVIMRLALALLWVRVARAMPAYRSTACRSAAGQLAMLAIWASVVFGTGGPTPLFNVLFVLAVVVELCVPAWAERARPTPWHPHHLIERQGLLLLIVLGELLLSATHALRYVTGQPGEAYGAVAEALGGMLIGFSIWWVYFAEAAHLRVLRKQPLGVWMHGHFVLFTACAAIGAGLGVAVEHRLGTAGLSEQSTPAGPHGVAIVGLATAICFATLWALRDRVVLSARHSARLLALAAVIAVAGLLGAPVLVLGLLAAGVLVMRLNAAPDLAGEESGDAEPARGTGPTV